MKAPRTLPVVGIELEFDDERPPPERRVGVGVVVSGVVVGVESSISLIRHCPSLA